MKVPFRVAWDFMFSEKGIDIWLGKGSGNLETGMDYSTSDGVQGKIRVFTPDSHIRMTWKPHDWDNDSVLQVRVIRSEDKTIISFHQEKLTSPEQREQMKYHWKEILEQIESKIKS